MRHKGRNHFLDRWGFTLTELMIVVAIIGILASIGIPKFSQLIAKSHESTTRANLGAIRAALSIYYGDVEGFYPSDDLTGSLLPGAKYLPAIPPAILPRTDMSPGHEGNLMGVLNGHIPDGSDDAATTDGWLYDNVNGSDTWGRIIVNCTHSEAHGAAWTSI